MGKILYRFYTSIAFDIVDVKPCEVGGILMGQYRAKHASEGVETIPKGSRAKGGTPLVPEKRDTVPTIVAGRFVVL